jgi:histidine ammonia-lyase
MNAPRPLTPEQRAQPIVIGAAPMTIEDVVAVACRDRSVALADDAVFRSRIDAGAAFLEKLIDAGGDVYGVNTGYGDSCDVRVPPELLAELPLHLTRYHGCGLGRHLDEDATLAVLVARVNSLAQGYSGVRLELLENLVALVNHRILPLIPEEGSVGASGDLTPLSYVAAALVGEREVRYRGSVRPAAAALSEAGIAPLTLKPKEGLALMNGTAVMTALACLAFSRAEYLTRLCSRVTALATVALRGNRGHFDPRLFAVKPHAGQNACAAWIFGDLAAPAGDADEPMRLQDRYSIRCAPHVIGVLRDALTWMRRDIEVELNSANDNPIVDGEAEQLYHGGHFYGGHIAFAMDGMKNAVANLADLMDRQLALLVDARYSHGLPQNLSGASGERAAINHGLKAVQIGASAWTAEALKLTMPASVFSRSTECHNQDKVSMGTIAARDCLRVLELTEQVVAAQLLACCQGLEIRRRRGEPELDRVAPHAREFFEAVRGDTPFIDEDQPLEATLRRLVAQVREQRWALYA